MSLAPGELKTVKKSLIETKPPVENDVKESLEYLLSHLNSKEENDKERVLFNDTLSICLLRYNHFSNTFEHSNKVFDYILTHVNRNYAPLQNSLNSIFEKLVMFQNADLPLWIDMLMQQSLTKNLFVLLERLLRRVPDRSFFISKYPDYSLQAMSMFTDNVANAISKTLIAIYEDSYLMYEKNTETWYKSWIRIINLQNDGVRANAITHLLPGLLRVDPQTFELLLADCKSNLKALVSILSMGLKMKLIKSLEVIDQKSLLECLVHADSAIRMDALQVLIGDRKETLTSYIFETIESNYLMEINLNEANHQDKFISTMYQFISGKLSDCLNGKFGKEVESETKSFFTRFKILLISHLETQNNFQQKMGAISILNQIHLKLENIFDTNVVKLLIDNLFSNYKLVRESSLDLLLQCNNLSEYFYEDKALAKKAFAILPRLAGRESEGAALAITFLAYYYRDTKNLDTLMETLYDGLDKESGEHGYLSALATITNKLGICGDYYVQLEAAKRATKKMTDILSTERIAYPSEHDFVKSKETVNYSWKVLQNANELFLSLLKQRRGIDDVVECFLLVVEQLHSIKFRAAISSSYPTMIAVARLLGFVDNEKVTEYMKREIHYIRSESKQLVTRRSGGLLYVIPAMLIASEKNKDIIDYVFGNLFEIASLPYESESKEDLPQVHAFNTLGQLFKESQLTSESSPFTERALLLSLKHFNAANWSVRNCALMLFGHLEKKIFSGANVNSKRFFARFKNIEDVFIDYLSCGQDQVVFPILIMLEKLEFTNSSLKLKRAVANLLSRNSWKVRELAAKISAAMLEADEFNEFITASLNSNICMNALHGVVLLLKYRPDIKIDIENHMDLAFGNFFIAKEYIEVLDKVGYKDTSKLGPYFCQIVRNKGSLNGGKQLFLETLVAFLMKNDEENRDNYIKLSFSSDYNNVHNRVLEYIEDNKIKCPSLVREFIMSNDFHYTKVKALKLYASMDDVLPFPLDFKGDGQLSQASFECLSRFVDDNDRSFYDKCVTATDASNEIDIRLMGYNAIFTYLNTCSDRTSFLYSSCLVLCFERGLFDDDEDIRYKANSYISEVTNCGHVATTYLTYRFPVLAKSILNEKYYNELVAEMTERNTLDATNLDKEFQDSLKENLYSFERNNFYKNEIDYTRRLAMFSIDTKELCNVKRKVLQDIQYLKSFREKENGKVENIPRDYILYDCFVKTQINAQIVGITDLDEELFSIRFCKMG
ncbi:conserved hypothetical protein [Candida dubliniensis CD36]|uniref:Uncharacterized protein n=1 Tax=Candida dubliniensis (strain CD36 / ATCC MYA-646 / CBS 7987 / NCPF 3949 / NRRL Y-17841) TaxID=573826 RepID=B9WCW1_CANDC|nr:conserved hypothetical protein [Candida dubliniensis CD36]CAX44236.1 conserved hypothetical protein [Candida dubliniensis CD36]